MFYFVFDSGAKGRKKIPVPVIEFGKRNERFGDSWWARWWQPESAVGDEIKARFWEIRNYEEASLPNLRLRKTQKATQGLNQSYWFYSLSCRVYWMLLQQLFLMSFMCISLVAQTLSRFRNCDPIVCRNRWTLNQLVELWISSTMHYCILLPSPPHAYVRDSPNLLTFETKRYEFRFLAWRQPQPQPQNCIFQLKHPWESFRKGLC